MRLVLFALLCFLTILVIRWLQRPRRGTRRRVEPAAGDQAGRDRQIRDAEIVDVSYEELDRSGRPEETRR